MYINYGTKFIYLDAIYNWKKYQFINMFTVNKEHQDNGICRDGVACSFQHGNWLMNNCRTSDSTKRRPYQPWSHGQKNYEPQIALARAVALTTMRLGMQAGRRMHSLLPALCVCVYKTYLYTTIMIHMWVCWALRNPSSTCVLTMVRAS